MIIYRENSVFDCQADAIVNTVNCFGVMGKGLALEFRLRFPEMYKDYVKKAENKAVKIGHLTTYKIEENNLLIVNFPTKYHWKNLSKIEWITSGLDFFKSNYKFWNINSIAFPKLGCDNGGLDWKEVSLVIENKLKAIKDINVFLCQDLYVMPESIEWRMLKILKSDVTWMEKLMLNKDIKNQIAKNICNIERFRDLNKIKCLDSKKYAMIFSEIYSMATSDKLKGKSQATKVIQLSLPV